MAQKEISLEHKITIKGLFFQCKEVKLSEYLADSVRSKKIKCVKIRQRREAVGKYPHCVRKQQGIGKGTVVERNFYIDSSIVLESTFEVLVLYLSISILAHFILLLQYTQEGNVVLYNQYS